MAEQVQTDKVITIHYRLRGVDGTELGSTHGGEPISYLHGHRDIVSGLEQELEGVEVGAELTITVQPEQGYGERDEEKVIDAERASFAALEPLQVGQLCQVSETGDRLAIGTIIELDDEAVTLDLNHPLAGQVLVFDVSVVGIREATADELAKGSARD